MKGLLIKDFLVLKEMLKIFLINIIGLIVMGLLFGDVIFFTGMLSVASVSISISVFSFDEKINWNTYALAMPLSPKVIVMQKYLLALIILTVTLFVGAALNIIVLQDVYMSVNGALQALCIALIFISVLLPLIFAFGQQKARMILGFIIIPTIIAAIFFEKVAPAYFNVQPAMQYFVHILAIACVALLIISMVISIKIYEKKEI